jgi:hypothetical protein
MEFEMSRPGCRPKQPKPAYQEQRKHLAIYEIAQIPRKEGENAPTTLAKQFAIKKTGKATNPNADFCVLFRPIPVAWSLKIL